MGLLREPPRPDGSVNVRRFGGMKIERRLPRG